MIMHVSGLVQYSPGDTRAGHNGKPVPHILEQIGYRHSIEIKDISYINFCPFLLDKEEETFVSFFNYIIDMIVP